MQKFSLRLSFTTLENILEDTLDCNNWLKLYKAPISNKNIVTSSWLLKEKASWMANPASGKKGQSDGKEESSLKSGLTASKNGLKKESVYYSQTLLLPLLLLRIVPQNEVLQGVSKCIFW